MNTRKAMIGIALAGITIGIGAAPSEVHTVNYKDIAAVVSRWTGVPVDKMMEGEREKLLRMEEVLGARVIGQRDAVAAVHDERRVAVVHERHLDLAPVVGVDRARRVGDRDAVLGRQRGGALLHLGAEFLEPFTGLAVEEGAGLLDAGAALAPHRLRLHAQLDLRHGEQAHVERLDPTGREQAGHTRSDRVVGMVVDSVSDVIQLSGEQIREAPQFGASMNTDYITGLGTVEQRMLILLDIVKLMTSSDMALTDQSLPLGRRVAAETVLRNTRVIAIDQQLIQGAAPTGGDMTSRTVTLEVAAEQAERLSVAMRLGRLSLSLRSATESAENSDSASRPIWARDVSPVLGAEAAPVGENVIRVFQGGAQAKEFKF